MLGNGARREPQPLRDGQLWQRSRTVDMVEDEAELARLLVREFEAAGYGVEHAPNGRTALRLFKEAAPDLLVLDWMLPQLSGLEICRRLRRRGDMRNVPIVMLTARGEETDRIRGLDTGADDYIVKPFSMTEFLARLRAVMRRVRPSLVEEMVTVGEISIDRGSHRVRRASRAGRAYARTPPRRARPPKVRCPCRALRAVVAVGSDRDDHRNRYGPPGLSRTFT